MISHIRSLFRAGQSDDPVHVKNWRLTITAGFVLLLLFASWSLGALEAAGLSRVAFAGEVDEKIQKALEPIQSQLKKQDDYLRRLVTKDIREELYNHYIELCAQQSASDRQKIRDDITDLQTEYESITGRRYPQPRCEDL